MDWIGLAQDRDRWRTLVSAVMNLRAPWNAGNFLTSCKPVSFSRSTLHHGVSTVLLFVLGTKIWDRPWCSPSHLFSGYQGLFFQGWSSWSVVITTYLHVVLTEGQLHVIKVFYYFLCFIFTSALSWYGSELQRLICGVLEQVTRVWYSATGREILRPTPFRLSYRLRSPTMHLQGLLSVSSRRIKWPFSTLRQCFLWNKQASLSFTLAPYLGPLVFLFFMAGQPPSGPRPLLWGFFDHTQLDTPHSIGLIGTSDRPVAGLLPHNTLDRRPSPGGIRTRNPSHRAAVGPRLRPRGHWDRQAF